MDVAYDHIQEETLSPEEAANRARSAEVTRQHNLNAEFQETYKSFASSSWGKSLGGFFSDVKKQGENFYDEAKQEAGAVGGEAFKGFTGLRQTLVGHARSMSAGGGGSVGQAQGDITPKATEGQGDGKARSESEALRESESVISRFRSEATKRLKDLEKAEEAADAAIFKFGANIGNFLKEAVSVAPPTSEEDKKSGKVLFESRDVDGKRVIHSTRFEAQLHAVHSSFDSFTKDPASPEYEKWKEDFDVEKKTEAVAKDLDKYEELRRAMEVLVPEQMEYSLFWMRYYFLRMVVETEEERRREILKGAAQSHTDETIAWDDDSDDDEQSSTPQQEQTMSITMDDQTKGTPESSTTLDPRDTTAAGASLKAAEPRRSQDGQSQAGSDASYDLVSGATSQAPGSPKEGKGRKDDEEEEEDWE